MVWLLITAREKNCLISVQIPGNICAKREATREIKSYDNGSSE